MTINDLVYDSYTTASSKGWWDKEESVGDKLALMHSEISEALEEFRNGRGMNEVYYSDKGKPEGIGIELADLLIRVGDFCGRHGIDLENAVKIKMEYNKTRPYRHGDKLL